MDKLTSEILSHSQQALDYNHQALAVLDMWMDSMTFADETESRRIAAVCSLVREAVSYLDKAVEVKG